MKRIFAFVFVLIMILGMIPFGVSAAEVTLEDEIKNTVIGGKLFDEDDYPAQAGAAAKIFGFSEVGYTYSGNFTNFGMYVYVYNPSQKVIKQNGSHHALMAVKFDEAGNALEWEEFDMVFVSRTDNNRFLKFKITDHVSSLDGKKIVNRVNRDARRYSVAELEMASYVSKRITTLAYMFYDDSIEENEASVSAEQLIAHIEKYDYADFLFADSVDTGRVKGTQTAKIAIGDTFNFENFSGVRDWFTNVWNSISGGEVLKKEFENVAPIYKVTAADMLIADKDELAQRLLVDVNDIDAIRVAYNEALLRNESLWLFRFAVTDYYAHDITFWQDSNQNSLANTHGYYAEQTVFLDFNIIELTCEKEGVATVIPVSSAKQDIAGDVTPPTDGVDANTDVNWDSLLAKLFSVIFVLIILAGFAYFLPIMQGVMNWLFPKKRE